MTITIWRGETALTVTVEQTDSGWRVEESIDEDGNPVVLSSSEESELNLRIESGMDETGY